METVVSGTRVAFEVVGSGATKVVASGMGWNKRVAASIFAPVASEWSVLLWDRPNTGDSSPCVSDTPGEHHLWCHVLHDLIAYLGWSAAALFGASNGAVMSLLFAHLYPEHTAAAILSDVPDDDRERWVEVSRQRYLNLADAARDGGMRAVLEFAERELQDPAPPPRSQQRRMNAVYRSLLSPENRGYVLGLQAAAFVRSMERWASWFASSRIPYANLTDTELGSINVPCGLVPGDGGPHPAHTAHHLHRMLRRGELLAVESGPERLPRSVPIMQDYLRRLATPAR